MSELHRGRDCVPAHSSSFPPGAWHHAQSWTGVNTHRRPWFPSHTNSCNSLENKGALATGGASGIGRATALTVAREGAKLVVADMHERRWTTDWAYAHGKRRGSDLRPGRCVPGDRRHARGSTPRPPGGLTLPHPASPVQPHGSSAAPPSARASQYR
jgi:hypothetical protein